MECVLKIQSNQLDLKTAVYEIDIIKLNLDPVSYELHQTIRLTSSEQLIKVRISKIFDGSIKMKKNGVVINERTEIYFSPEQVNIYLNERGITDVRSKQNDFRYKNRFLLFSLPAAISRESDFSITLFRKKQNSISFPNNYMLQLMIEEYQQKVIRELKQVNQFIHAIKAVNDIKEYLTIQTLDSCLNVLSRFKESSEQYNLLLSYAENLKGIQPGNQLPFFEMKDEEGRFFSSALLNAVNADYILVDFWASWCIPCRAQMKKFKEIYSSVDTSKFKIVSVSFDLNSEDWFQAIKKDSVIWKNFIVSGGVNGATAKLLSLSYIPQNILISKDGKIFDLELDEVKLTEFVNEYALKYIGTIPNN